VTYRPAFNDRAYAVGARVNQSPAGSSYVYSAYTHLILLVQPFENSNQTYIVDVGIGSTCLMRPLLLSTDPNNVIYGLTETERHRLVFEPRPDSSLGQCSFSLEPGKCQLAPFSPASASDFTENAGGQWNVEVGHRKTLSGPET
jgi:hypothetical protein